MSVDLASVHFDYALLCEDVRREDNGKFLFIGVFANNIILDKPGLLRLRLVTRFTPKVHRFPISYRIKVGGVSRLVIRGEVSSDNLETDTVSTPEIAVPFDDAGEFEIQAIDAEIPELDKTDHLDWKTLLVLPVILRPEDASSG